MWTVVYIAPNKKEATRIQNILTKEGILVKLRELSPSHCGHNCSVEILVPEAEVDEALEIINTI
ncbi:DUF2007 domain-containing protein [Desulfofundulus sp. TPOSR]|uniref:DUF2007 domain-containing protein n=1 Tax=Desulfofundulus kuznetsovii (strain DSM 6115 / VKM B-1805 / 17) TaxID=760568 RepID=A0AAU8PYS0_DESK7|nr:DUF2007 domain-containing protein [Desulfofundulus sp. TPOSR]AEG15233.1 hypothetical protein Desku_1655 [Desulfofundulus kuznetsovii DSM 6115]NHM28318.1 DUF2007 domain-containing protein [Desulfofundulus sp. TPOSR]